MQAERTGTNMASKRTGTDVPSEGVGTRLPSKNTGERNERLTNSSSATEAGEEGRGIQAKARRQPLFAGARG